MDQTHLHLIITHLPIFGSILGSIILIQGLLTKSDQTKIAAYNLFIISAIGAGIAYITGESAEETVENIQGISENFIEQHEDSAKISLIASIILGVGSLTGVVLMQKKPFPTTIAIAILFLSFISFGLVARTGYLGGQIRHTEISKNVAVGGETEGNEEEHEEDDD